MIEKVDSLPGQRADTKMKVSEPLILGLPAPEAEIDLLQDNSKLEDAERLVKSNTDRIAPGSARVSVEKLVPCMPARLGGECRNPSAAVMTRWPRRAW